MVAVDVPRDAKQSSIVRLIDYLADDQDRVSRVGEIRIAGCYSPPEDPHFAALEMQAVQNANTRAVSDKTMHLIISFRAGEDPRPDTLAQIEERFVNDLGFAKHQRFSVVHRDTDNLHLHLAINKINPENYTIHNPRWSHKTLAQTCRQLERELGLAADNHDPKKTASENQIQTMERMTGEESLASWIRRECLEEMALAQTWRDLHQTLAKAGLALRERGNGLVFVAMDTPEGAAADLAVKASTVDRSLSKAALVKKLGDFDPAAVSIHAQIGDTDNLSINQAAGKTGKIYKKNPLPCPARNQAEKEARTRLREEFEKQAATDKDERERLIKIIKDARDRHLNIASLDYKAALAKTKLESGRYYREGLRNRASQVYKAQAQAIRALARQELGKVFVSIHASKMRQGQFNGVDGIGKAEKRQQWGKSSWLEWLQKEAEKGRMEAVAALRSRAFSLSYKNVSIHAYRRHLGDTSSLSTFQSTPIGDINNLIIDKVTKNGSIIYRVGNEAVKDRGNSFDLSREAGEETLIMALRLAQIRFGGKLYVSGTREFQQRVAAAAEKARIPLALTTSLAQTKNPISATRGETNKNHSDHTAHGKERT